MRAIFLTLILVLAFAPDAGAQEFAEGKAVYVKPGTVIAVENVAPVPGHGATRHMRPASCLTSAQSVLRVISYAPGLVVMRHDLFRYPGSREDCPKGVITSKDERELRALMRERAQSDEARFVETFPAYGGPTD